WLYKTAGSASGAGSCLHFPYLWWFRSWLAEASDALVSVFLPAGCRLKELLTGRERREAVRGAFATSPGSQVDKKRFLLVDDVMTTGAMLEECARVLREAGAIGVHRQWPGAVR